MKLLSRFNVSRESNGPRKFSVEMTMSGVVSLCIVVLLGMCWVFILGILLGRGYRPENAVPQLAQMMPTTEANKLPDDPMGAPPTALKPEDLTFMEGSQSKEGEVVADSTQKAPVEPRKVPSPAPAVRDLVDSRPAPAAKASPQSPAAPPAAKNPAKAQPLPRPAVEDNARSKAVPDPKSPFTKQAGGQYRATYQVASFPAKDQAEAMAKRLAGKGVAATIREAKSNNRTVFRVNIQLKGTEADITEGLKKSGEKGPILLEKKPL